MPYFKKILFLSFLFLILSLTLNTTPALARTCKSIGIRFDKTDPAPPIPVNIKSLSITIWDTGTGKMAPATYRLSFCGDHGMADHLDTNCIIRSGYSLDTIITATEPGPATLIINNPNFLTEGNHTAILDKNGTEWCNTVNYEIGKEWDQCTMSIEPKNPPPRDIDPIRLILSKAPQGEHTVRWSEVGGPIVGYKKGEAGNVKIDDSGHGILDVEPLNFSGDIRFYILDSTGKSNLGWCNTPIKIKDNAGDGIPPRPLPSITPIVEPPPSEGVTACKEGNANCSSAAGQSCNVKNGHTVITEKNTSDPDKPKTIYKDKETDEELKSESIGVLTAIGCIPTEPTIFIKGLLKFAGGIAGGIALLMLITGAFQMITSAGNPEAVKKGAEQMTSAVIGLLFIIFSVLLMEVIGVDVLGIPGLGK